MSSLRVFLFGPVRLAHADERSPVKLTRVGRTLLAYLLLQRCRSQPRELVAGLFWGDSSEERARRCLNTALWRLRQVLEPDGISRGTYLLTTSTGEIGFNSESDYWLDVEIFEEKTNHVLAKPVQAMEAADVQILEQTLQLYSGDFLEGFYDDWALRERERLRRLYLNSLAHMMHYFKEQRAFDASLACGRQILDQDPLREEIHREIMLLYLESGRRPLALRQYEHCCEVLAAELGICPMEETQALYTRIVQAAAPDQAKLAPAGPPASFQKVLQQLRLARQEFDQAREQLRRAIQLAEQFTVQRHRDQD